MLRNLVGTVTKGVVLGAIVVGAKKLYEKRHTTPMKEPLEPEVTSYDGKTATFSDTQESSMNTVLSEGDLVDDDVAYRESPILTKP